MRSAGRTSDAASVVDGWSSVNVWCSNRLTGRSPVGEFAHAFGLISGQVRASNHLGHQTLGAFISLVLCLLVANLGECPG